MGGIGWAYELRVELGQPWLALAVKDQKGVDHIGGLCGLKAHTGSRIVFDGVECFETICCEIEITSRHIGRYAPAIRYVT